MINLGELKPHSKKPVLSTHQRKVRFIKRLSFVVSLLLVAVLFWWMNHTNYARP